MNVEMVGSERKRLLEDRPMRSLLFTPGHRERMVAKALELRVDAVILDMEDGVPPDQKDAARAHIASVITSPRARWHPMRFVRVNAADTGRLVDDLTAVTLPGLDGVVVPKVHEPLDVLRAAMVLAGLEEGAGIKPDSVPLLAAIESARGVMAASEIARSHPRVVALVLGAEDLALDLGMPVTRVGIAHDLLVVRSTLAIAAAFGRVAAIDQVWTDFHDVEGLRTDAANARQLGFRGKCIIHPEQAEVTNEIFTPSAEEIRLADRIVKAFAEAEAAGVGAVMLGGQLVERPIVDRAIGVLRAAAVIDDRSRE